MKKTYKTPLMTVKTFNTENIVTVSGAAADQVADIKSKMNAQLGGEVTVTEIIEFKNWD